jgi:hypothetical protein
MGKKKEEEKEARLLVFDSEDETSQNRFEVVYTAIRSGFPKHSKGLEALRICNAIMGKIEKISTLVPKPATQMTPGDEWNRELKSGRQELLLVGHEFGKLKAMVKDSEIGWGWRLGPHAEETIDWLDSEEIEEVDIEVKKEKIAEVKAKVVKSQ